MYNEYGWYNVNIMKKWHNFSIIRHHTKFHVDFLTRKTGNISSNERECVFLILDPWPNFLKGTYRKKNTKVKKKNEKQWEARTDFITADST